jgi:hypothetical protein
LSFAAMSARGDGEIVIARAFGDAPPGSVPKPAQMSVAQVPAAMCRCKSFILRS